MIYTKPPRFQWQHNNDRIGETNGHWALLRPSTELVENLTVRDDAHDRMNTWLEAESIREGFVDERELLLWLLRQGKEPKADWETHEGAYVEYPHDCQGPLIDGRFAWDRWVIRDACRHLIQASGDISARITEVGVKEGGRMLILERGPHVALAAAMLGLPEFGVTVGDDAFPVRWRR